eukprot:CAMPEP_0196786586 /NCGR_PEP_ID=MMETSP1104-20130614/21641_1 /TAXON_ID=33652 /ORGANISM="Cafeteria sp., Strain Caron Lab Isolate" /LENGTH=145 /DNA_ID=CAMNT_0042156909 /DNA_START=39 /DNA_END=476 /DNA_ORIENTATION=-
MAGHVEEAPAEVLNERAVQVLQRIRDKLTGRDFLDMEESEEHEEVHGRDRGARGSRVRAVRGDASRDGRGSLRRSLRERMERRGTLNALPEVPMSGSSATGELEATEIDDEEIVVGVEDQVDQLIREATSTLNLCQCYIGWGPFW